MIKYYYKSKRSIGRTRYFAWMHLEMFRRLDGKDGYFNEYKKSTIDINKEYIVWGAKYDFI